MGGEDIHTQIYDIFGDTDLQNGHRYFFLPAG